MANPYPNSGKKLKMTVRVLNILGYLLGDLCGAGLGCYVAYYLFQMGSNGYLAALAGILSAGAVAGLVAWAVWFRGLILWNISDANDNSKALCEKLDA